MGIESGRLGRAEDQAKMALDKLRLKLEIDASNNYNPCRSFVSDESRIINEKIRNGKYSIILDVIAQPIDITRVVYKIVCLILDDLVNRRIKSDDLIITQTELEAFSTKVRDFMSTTFNTHLSKEVITNTNLIRKLIPLVATYFLPIRISAEKAPKTVK